MIRIALAPTFEREVPIAIPGKDEPEMASFTFNVLTEQQLYPLIVMSGGVGAGWFRRQRARLAMCWRMKKWVDAVDLLAPLIKSWSGFDVDYSRDNLRMLLLRFPQAKASIFFAYFGGIREARLKN